jgi:hypothetical protein
MVMNLNYMLPQMVHSHVKYMENKEKKYLKIKNKIYEHIMIIIMSIPRVPWTHTAIARAKITRVFKLILEAILHSSIVKKETSAKAKISYRLS